MPRLPLDTYKRRKPRRVCLRSLCPYFITFVLFSLALGSYGILKARLPTPAKSQHMGWQAWDTVRLHQNTSTEGTVDSLPLDVWDPMAAHTTGLTEIAVKWCLISPKITRLCWPKTTPEDDMARGNWVLVESDLNILAGRWGLYLYYRRTRRFDVPLIDQLRMYPDPPPADADLDDWVRAAGNLREGVRESEGPLNLWYKLRGLNHNTSIVTEILPLFGDDDPFFGFRRVEGGKIVNGKKSRGKWDSVDLTYRRGNPVAPVAMPLRFHEDGTFKIMQIADLHYSVGNGECRDTDRRPCIGDPESASWLSEALDIEKPDFVVFSGDQLNGQKTSYDSPSVLAKFAKPVINRKIPWAAVFGNHDSEIAHDRMEQMRALQRMPYSLARAGPLNVDGVGNYDIGVFSPDGRTQVFTLYFLDSGAYQPTIVPFITPDYDFIQDSQVEWFLNTSAGIEEIERPYLPHSERRETTKSKPNAMAWWHIPLQEAYKAADKTTDKGYEGSLDIGSMLDGEGSSRHPSNMFTKAIKGAFEGPSSRVSEVKVLSHGHCHLTDRCRRVEGVWACFNGGSSFSGYGQEGFDRRVRVYELGMFGERISTFKRTAAGEIVDKQVLVGEGAPPGWGVGSGRR